MTGAHDRITAEVTSWPGVEAGYGSRGEWAFSVGGRQLGHLHGDRVAHFSFPTSTWEELFAQGRITYHPVFPQRKGPAARAIASEEDLRDVVALLRLSYDAQRKPTLPVEESGVLPWRAETR